MATKLTEIEIMLGQMLLDPNNPRFVQRTQSTKMVTDEEAATEEIQEAVLRLFSALTSDQAAEESDEPDTTSIQDLRDSMLRIGYVAIDKIVVRRIHGKDTFVVLEGNRRVAALKSIKRDYDGGHPPFHKAPKRADYERHRESFEKLTVLELKTDGLSIPEIQKAVSVILGIRHHGSLLPWEPVARAFNIYCEYKKLAGDDFVAISPTQRNSVAERLCILPGEVKQALRSYIAYLQLREVVGEDVRNEDFSLIETAVGNKHLCTRYLNVDENTYRLDGASLERLIRICQFGRRDKLPKPGGPKKIIADPRVMRRLAQIVQKRVTARSDTERAFVENILARIEDEGDTLSVDDGLEETIAYLASLNWREAVADLLHEQSEKLTEQDYEGTDNERGYREEAQRIVDNIALIMKL
jgi:hypothetical protein